MADEEKSEEVKEAVAPAAEAPAEEAPAAEAAPAPEAAPADDGKKKKLSRLSLAEVEAKLAAAKKNMGGEGSDYVQELLKRKKTLQS